MFENEYHHTAGAAVQFHNVVGSYHSNQRSRIYTQQEGWARMRHAVGLKPLTTHDILHAPTIMALTETPMTQWPMPMPLLLLLHSLMRRRSSTGQQRHGGRSTTRGESCNFCWCSSHNRQRLRHARFPPSLVSRTVLNSPSFYDLI